MLTQVELEKKLIYAVIVAGKDAQFADNATERLFKLLDGPTPFTYLSKLHLDDIENLCRTAKTGAYKKNSKALWQLAYSPPDLLTCGPEVLERYHGIGMKTSRFFIVWTRPEARYAVLDTHILRWMSQQGIWTPGRTPRYESTYLRLERIFIKEADRLGLTPRQLDWQIWSEAAKYKGTIQSGPRSTEATSGASGGKREPEEGHDDPKTTVAEGY